MLIQCGVNTQHSARLLTADPNHEMVRGSWCWTQTHRCRYSGVFSCQPVRWFPPAQVLQYANMLAACDGCSAVCRLQVRNAMLQLGRWIIIIIGSGLFSHQACILQLRHSAHCSAATLAVVIITQSIITLFISKPYPSSHYFGRQAKYQCLNKENRYAELLMTL